MAAMCQAGASSKGMHQSVTSSQLQCGLVLGAMCCPRLAHGQSHMSHSAWVDALTWDLFEPHGSRREGAALLFHDVVCASQQESCAPAGKILHFLHPDPERTPPSAQLVR